MSKARKRTRGPRWYRETDLGYGVLMRWRDLPCSDGECEHGWARHPHGYVAMGGHDRWVPVCRTLTFGEEGTYEEASSSPRLHKSYAKLLIAFGVPWEKLWDVGLATVQAMHVFDMTFRVNEELATETMEQLHVLTVATPHSRFEAVEALLLLMSRAREQAERSDTWLPDAIL